MILLLVFTVLEQFYPAPPRQHYPELGSPLTLRCIPPRSIPEALIIWVTFESDEFIPVEITDRISIDPHGKHV